MHFTARRAIAFAAAVLAAAPARTAGPSLLFRDISALSGGPVDFGSPTSDSEKATGGWIDVDGDGWDDLVTLTGPGQPCGYFLNRPDGAGGRALVPAPPGNGLDDGPAFERDGAAITAGDVDGDGDEDLYVGCGWRLPWISGENLLLLNDGTGRFTDATAAAGLLDGDNTTAACMLFDMDLDGDLDLLTVNANLPGLAKPGNGRLRLFRNALRETGGLAFADETAARLATLVDNKGIWGLLAPDVDGDGDPDLVLARDIHQRTELWRNDGTGRFTDATAESGGGAGDDGDPSTFGNDSPNAMGVCAADVDNDGILDLYITDIDTNPLYVGLPGGRFVERGASAGVGAGGVTWGCVFADFDLDGRPDLHVAGGDLYGLARPEIRSFLFRNRGDGAFDDVTEGSGLRHDVPLHREMGTAASDFDGDGRTDLLVVRAEGGQPAPPYLYRNETDVGGNAWITVALRGNGTTSNGSAIGARVRVFPRDAEGARIPGLAGLREIESSTGRSGRSTLAPTFGLGPDAATADVEVTWPRTGALESRRDLYALLPVRGRVLLRDGPAVHRRLLPESAATVPGGAPSRIPLALGEGTGGPTTVLLEDGPDWARVDRDEDGTWVLHVEPPVLDGATAATATATLLGVDEGEGGRAGRQVLSLTVRQPPAVTSCAPGPLGRVLHVEGINLPRRRGRALVDGVPSRRVRVLPGRDADGDATAMRILIPRGPEGRGGSHEVVIEDPRTGLASAPFGFEGIAD